jgi:hypothetical protein
MNIWGISIHPQTFAMADEVAHTAVMMARFLSAVYALMLQDAVEELIIAATFREE